MLCSRRTLRHIYSQRVFGGMKLSVVLRTLLNITPALDEGGIITLPLAMWSFYIRNTLIDVLRLLLNIALLAFYVTFCLDNHLHQRKHWLLGERLAEVSCLESILELPCKHLLVWGNYLDCGFIESDEIAPQPFWWTLSYIEQTGGWIFLWQLVMNGCTSFFSSS